MLVSEFPDCQWKITNEKKVILEDTCITAIGKVWDKEIIAWYSPRLPAGFGIHHYVGLPGTILEIYTPHNKIQTTAINIDETSPEIVEPNFSKRVSVKTYWQKRNSTGDPRVYWEKMDFIE